MMESYKRSRGINGIGWGVIAANSVLLIVYYLSSQSQDFRVPAKIVSVIAMLAVFPLDFYDVYVDHVVGHVAWMFTMMLSAFGILLLNQFARTVFITLNIIHIVILGYFAAVAYPRGPVVFLDHFFKLYFNLVASGVYVGFITIPEVREQFKVDLEEMKFRFFAIKAQLQQTSPRDARSFYNLGVAYGRLGRHRDSIAALSKAVHFEPENAKFCYQLGLEYMKIQEYSQAARAFKETVRLDPLQSQAFYHLGVAYQKEGCSREAISALEKAAHARPNDAGIHRHLGEAYLSQGRMEEALASFRECTRWDPDEADVFCQIGRIHLKQEDRVKEAMEAFQRAVQLKPKDVDALLGLGAAALKRKRYKDAVRAFKDVLRQNESHKHAHYQLGFAYALLEDFGSARRELAFLKAHDPDLAENLRMLIP